MTVDEILSAFAGVEDHADGYLALCSAHRDSNPSLRIWIGEDGRVRLHCRAGCTADAVVKAAKLSFADLFDVSLAGARLVPAAKPGMADADALTELRTYVSAAANAYAANASVSEYAERRFGVTESDAERFQLGADAGELSSEFKGAAYRRFPRLVVPLLGFDGVAHGAQGRDVSGGCPMRWVSLSNPQGARWGAYGVLRGGGGYPVTVITEGPGDGLTAASAGYDVVFIRGASLAANPEIMKEIADGLRGNMVIAAGDADSAGARFNAAVGSGLQPFGIDVRSLEIGGGASDISAWREADDQGFASAFHAAVRGASPIDSLEPGILAERSETAVIPSGRAADILSELSSEYESSDVLNAYALQRFSGNAIRHCGELGFFGWTGTHWEAGEEPIRAAAHMLGSALKKAADAEHDKEIRARLRSASRGCTVSRSIDSLLRELRACSGVVTRFEQFDAAPHLLNFRNGTVDLRSGELRPHDPDDLITTCIDLDYKPDAVCPRWLSFLDEIFPGEPDLPGFVQRLTGYGITGSTSEQCFAVLWGNGSNGKSIFTETLRGIFGPVSKTTGFSTFEEKPSGGIPNDIAALRNTRIVIATEGEAGKPMSESTLKRCTGCEQMQARFMRKEFFEFTPKFLIMLATNHKPKFRGADDGLWRRVKMIPFTRFFAPAERDHSLSAKLLREAEGIVAWAVAGAVEWFARGLQEPDVIRAATLEYRESSDALAGFFGGEFDILQRVEGARTNGADIYHAYIAWCEEEGFQRRWERPTLYAALEERKVAKKRGAKGMVFTGVSLPAAPNGPGIFNREDG